MYQPPVAEIGFTLRTVAGLGDELGRGALADLTPDVLDAVLEEAARFAGAEIAPLAPGGDRAGARWQDGAVAMPEGWRDLYRRWRENGWNALGGPAEHGGQGLPMAVTAAVSEMWNGASMAFGLVPMLTAGAVEAIAAHGSADLKRRFLPKLVSGEWTGTMNLTEPQAGSDLSAIRTRAERREDGSYRVFGQKIYITFGEHDLADNIVHLVLARLPDAPAGVRGLSLILVPKFLPDAEGRPGRRNDVRCHSIEEKLGIHASPTCTMIFGDGIGEVDEPGAVGWLVGAENRGLGCMFTMMNAARLLVGVQGVGVAEAAFQAALGYAQERRQGRSTLLAPRAAQAGGTPAAAAEMAPIVEHPDVAKTLLRMRALTAMARALCYACGAAIDGARAEGTAGTLEGWSARAGLLTPVAKAFGSDVGVEVASLGLQVHGGMGYVEETGAARLLRDARIAPIYEGTNGIQAVDLATRKLPLGEGTVVRAFLAECEAVAKAVGESNRPAFGSAAERLATALRWLGQATDFLLERGRAGEAETVLAGATSYLRLFALTAGTALLAKGALAEPDDDARATLARFAAESVLSEAAGLAADVLGGSASLIAARALLDAA